MFYWRNKQIESIGLTSCEFNDECNFCNDPQNGSYARMTGYNSSEIAYFICGKCALDKIRKGVESCSEIKPPLKKVFSKLVEALHFFCF
jgi:hypothetical protein